MPHFLRSCLPVVVALFCCACSTPEEKADAAFSELTAMVRCLRGELAAITNAEQAERALPQLEEQAEELRDILERIDELAIHPEMTPEARKRVGETHHAPLQAEVDAIVAELIRMGRRGMQLSENMKRLIRRETAHYGTRGVHPWPRAVLRGRVYRPKKGGRKQ